MLQAGTCQETVETEEKPHAKGLKPFLNGLAVSPLGQGCQGHWHGQAVLAPWCLLPSPCAAVGHREEASQSQAGRGETQGLWWGNVALQETHWKVHPSATLYPTP